MTLTDTQLAQFARLKSEVLDAIVDLVDRLPDEFFTHTSAHLQLAEKLGIPGQYGHQFHHDPKGRANKIEHEQKWETLRARRTA